MLAVLVAAALVAADKSEKIAIVDLDAPPGMLGLSTQVTKAIIAEATKNKRNLISPDELREKLGNKTMNELARCADKPACVADKLTVIGATKAVLGKLNRDDKNYLLQLWFIDLNKLEVITDVDRSILIASRRFQKDVVDAVPGFLRGEREARGTLTINATTTNAQVTINNEFMGVAPLSLTLKPGKYEVRVEKPKFLSVKRLVNVEPNQKNVEEFRMLLQPGQREEEEIKPLVGTGNNATDKAGGFSPSAPTFVLAATTIIAFGVGLGFGVVSKGTTDSLFKGYDAATDRYAGTRAEALAAQQNALLANVFYGIAGAAFIATVIFAILDATDPGPTTLEVVPAATEGGGGIVIGGRF